MGMSRGVAGSSAVTGWTTYHSALDRGDLLRWLRHVCDTGRMRKGWLMLAVLVTLVGACFGLSFVNADRRQQNLRMVDEVIAVVDGSDPGTVVAYTGRDSVARPWRVSDSGSLLGTSGPSEVPGEPRTQVCVSTVCYRVARTALRVEVSDDGGQTYATAWEVSGATYTMLAKVYPDVGNPAEHLSSRSLVVHATAGGHVVFVANGRDGLLYRDVSGAWRRLGFPTSVEGCCSYEPPIPIASDPQSFDLTIYAVGVVLVAILLSGVITAIARRRWQWTNLLAVVVLAALAGYGTELAGHFPGGGMLPGFICGVPLILIILAGGVGLAVWFVSGPRSRGPVPANNRARSDATPP
jgi:hypothetical protein